jgi:hypothetical protein
MKGIDSQALTRYAQISIPQFYLLPADYKITAMIMEPFDLTRAS